MGRHERSSLMASSSVVDDDTKSATTLKTTPVPEGQEGAHCPDVLRAKGFEIREAIASGGFSQVFKAVGPDRYGVRKIMACKVITFDKAPAQWKASSLNNELKISRHLAHENIVNVHHITKTMRHAYIFMELADTTVAAYIDRVGHGLTEERTQMWFRQMVKGLEYMCLHGVAHRDLKTDNLLLVVVDGAAPIVKIADFGFACYVKDKVTKRLRLASTLCGTRSYMAPELYSGKPYDPRFSDMWSAGVILFEMLTSKFPFPFSDPRFTDKDFVECAKHRAWKFPKALEHELTSAPKDLTMRLLEFNPKKRYDASQCLAHPFLKV